jgi:mRNA interferase MazF
MGSGRRARSLVTTRPYCPKRGDVVWLKFDPQVGHEQAGRRPALTLSPDAYNKKIGLAIFCPITSQIKNYPFEVSIPAGLKVTGVILSDQIKSLDWKIRDAQFCCSVSEEVISEVFGKLKTLIDFDL